MPGPRKKTSKGLCRVTVTHRVRQPDGNFKKVTRYFERKTWREAEAAANAYRETIGQPVQDPGGTLAEAFELVDAALWSKLDPDTRKGYNSYRRQVEAKIGHRNVKELTSPEITRYLAPLGGRRSSRTIDEHVKVVNSALDYCVSDLGWITENVARNARKPKGKPTARKPELERATFDLVQAHLAEPVRLLMRIVAETGMRPKEVRNVRAGSVVYRYDRYWIDVTESKTTNGIRLVPIGAKLADEIDRAGDPFAALRALAQPRREILTAWKRAFRAMNQDREGKGLAPIAYTNPYQGRSMRLTEFVRAGMTEGTMTRLAGHSDPRTTKQHYIRLGIGDVASELDALGEALGVEHPA